MPEQTEDPGKALKEKSLAEFAERTKGRPAPTQDENDRAKLGEHVIEKEHDGSDPDPSTLQAAAQKTKQSTAQGSGAPYQTKQATPAKPTT